MQQLSVLSSVDDVPVAEWDELTQRADLDFSRGFLQFREYLEPGESVLLTIRSAGRLRGALRGVMSVMESGLTSDPWKFVSAEAVLRLRDEFFGLRQSGAQPKRLTMAHATRARPGIVLGNIHQPCGNLSRSRP